MTIVIFDFTKKKPRASVWKQERGVLVHLLTEEKVNNQIMLSLAQRGKGQCIGTALAWQKAAVRP